MARHRKVKVRGKKLNYNAGIEAWYKKRLAGLVTQMTTEVQKEVKRLFERLPVKPFATDESIGSQARILMNELTKKFENLFALESLTLADFMLERMLKASETNLKSSLRELSGGLSIKTSIVPAELRDVVKASIAENVSLIKSIPAQYFTNVTGDVMRSITSGAGMFDLLPQIKKYGMHTHRRAELLALDQTRKAYTSVNVARLNALGTTRFEWVHSAGGQTPRESHVKISGQVFTFANLEAEQAALDVPKQDRGLPGYPIGCRCSMAPISQYEVD